MIKEQRNEAPPIPDNFSELLNEWQHAALQKIEGFGWKLKFIRRPMFQERLIVVTNPKGDRIGILQPNGDIDIRPYTDFRRRQA